MRAARVAAILVAALAGVVAGGALTLAVQGERLPAETPPVVAPPVAGVRTPEPPETLLAWTPGRLPEGFAARARGLPSVRHAVVVRSGTAWLTESRSAAGAVVDRPVGGLAIPVETASVDPTAYRPFLPPAERTLLAALARGEGVLGASGAELRGIAAGGSLRFAGVTVRVAGVLPDELVGAHELLVGPGLGTRLAVVRPRYALIDPADGASKTTVARALRRLIPSGTPLRVRAPGETPYFRHGDAVLPPVAMKSFFGEFAARPVAAGWLRIDPGWVRDRVATEPVPILGRVTCARALFGQLRAALRDVARAGLGHLLDPGDFGGCYAPRFLNRDASAGISHHAWGAAIDLNVSENPFGRVPSMDRRIVEVFERWGFTWGGEWLVPDGMHFELIRAMPAA